MYMTSIILDLLSWLHFDMKNVPLSQLIHNYMSLNCIHLGVFLLDV